MLSVGVAVQSSLSAELERGLHCCVFASIVLSVGLAVQSSLCAELERDKAELMLNSLPVSDTKSRQTVASLLQQLDRQQQINVRIVSCFQ